jgi:acetolactate synthase-1/2/3 large subunit
MHGGDLVARELERQGVRFLFTLCGGHISPILVGAKRLGIRIIDVRDEATAAFAADAMSRLTGVPGVAAVTAGPGVTNAVTAVMNARLAQSPFVLLGGATATLLRGRGSLQDIDQLALLQPQVKWLARATRVAEAPGLLARAFHEARSGVPGPVFLELPVDLLYPEEVARQWYAAAAPPKGKGGFRGKLMRRYLDRHADRLFKGGSGPAEGASPMPQKPAVDVAAEAQIGQLGRALDRAERPVFVVGSQAMLDTRRVGELASALSSLGVPVYLAGMARGLLGAGHPLQRRHARKLALREADCVLLAGVPCDFRLDYGNQIGRATTLLSVNRSSEDLTKNRRPTVGVRADPADALIRLGARLLLDPQRLAPWIQKTAEREAARDREIAEKAATPAASGVNPLRLFRELDTRLDERSILVADGGDFVATAAYIVRPRSPLCWLDPGVFGTLGVGAGFSIAAAALRAAEGGNGRAQVWTIWGDGAFGFALAEIDTLARHGLPVIGLVGNDASWAQIARDQVEILGDDVGTTLAPSDYHRIAEGFSIPGGRRVVGLEMADDAAIQPTLDRARHEAAAGHPVIVNVRLAASDFRKGSLSM